MLKRLGKKSRRTANQIKGDALENRTVRLFKNLGKWNVKKDITLTDKHGNRSQIDVSYGIWPFKTFIECKNYSKKSVPLRSVNHCLF